jgi:hypothetical protein
MTAGSELSPEENAVLDLILVKGRSADDIADTLGLSRVDVERLARTAAQTLGVGTSGEARDGADETADEAQHPKLTQLGDIVVPQDLEYEQRAYRVRLVFAVVFGLVLVAALLGLLGRSGPLSSTTKSAGDVGVDYERFVRLQTPTELTVHVRGGAHKTNVALSRSFLESFQVDSFSVDPESTAVTPDRVVYTFDQQAPSAVTVVLEPQRVGRQTGTIYGPGQNAVRISQWVWP